MICADCGEVTSRKQHSALGKLPTPFFRAFDGNVGGRPDYLPEASSHVGIFMRTKTEEAIAKLSLTLTYTKLRQFALYNLELKARLVRCLHSKFSSPRYFPCLWHA